MDAGVGHEGEIEEHGGDAGFAGSGEDARNVGTNGAYLGAGGTYGGNGDEMAFADDAAYDGNGRGVAPVAMDGDGALLGFVGTSGNAETAGSEGGSRVGVRFADERGNAEERGMSEERLQARRAPSASSALLVDVDGDMEAGDWTR